MPLSDEPVMMACPKCKAEQEDFDGMGVAYCGACGYCAHFSRTGMLDDGLRCDTCGHVLSREDSRE